MTAMGNTRAASSNRDYSRALTKGALAAGVAGCAIGAWQGGAFNSYYLPAGAAVTAGFALYWMLAALHLRKPALARHAAANVRAAVAALPPIPRFLVLPPPARPSSARTQAPHGKSAEARRGAERSAPPQPEPQSTIDTERARLRALGYSDAEVSRILVEQAAGKGAARGSPFGSGVATGFLNNLGAMLHYFGEHIPSFKSDFEQMFDESSRKADRAGGAMSFALKVAAIGIAGYYLWIESIAFRGRALEEWNKGCLAAQDNAIKHATLGQLMEGGHLAGDDCDPRPL